jgi:hypothetical protein
LALARYTYERYGWPFGVQSMQGGEKANQGFRDDCGQTGNHNNHRSSTQASTAALAAI